MPYVALEWDHKIGCQVIQWLVVKCQSVGEKFGGPQALPPRRDIAYFVDEHTAKRDATAFAAYKTRLEEQGGAPLEPLGTTPTYSHRHAAFSWDHNIFNPLIQWAVLEWNGENLDQPAFARMWPIPRSRHRRGRRQGLSPSEGRACRNGKCRRP